mgnify:CR=1 FL=1
MKKKLLICIFLCLIFSFANKGKVNLTIFAERDESKIITSKNTNGVKHFGTNQYVMVPNEYEVLNAEMRGVWVATVYNIAISKQNGLTDEAIQIYQNEFLEILNRMNEFGMNTIFFQVRPNNDSFYQSTLNPWSKFLVGEGVNPGWDPLEWMIEETHKRGYRFYCWMNAFRVTTESYVTTGKALNSKISDLVQMKHSALAKLADNNFAKLHPEYVVAGLYDEKLILNPSEPMVQKFIVDTIMEIVENYAIDGLHFDDYFYLEGATSSNTENSSFVGYNAYTQSDKDIMNDIPNYLKYQQNPSTYGIEAFGKDGIYGMPSGLNLGDFRRENINNMMRNIRKKIDEYNQKNNTFIEFGTKPAAVWRSNSEYCSAGSSRCVENGSNTHEGAYSTYNDLYADSLKWVQEGLVDWVAPQVYYAFEDEYAPYADVVDWWVEQVRLVNEKRILEDKKEIRLYIAQGIYKYRDNPDQFYRSMEIIDQLKYNNKYTDVLKGSAVYSYEILYKTLGSDIVNQYPNAEKIRKGAMNQFKNLWSNNQVFPVMIGDYDASNLVIDEYQLKENSTKQGTIQFKTIIGASCYGYYKVPKDVPFDINNLMYRQNVFYAGYEENKSVNIMIDEIDQNYDYYIVPVSIHGHIATNITKIDLTTVEKNVAPNEVEVILDLPDSNEVLTGSILSGYFYIPVDENGDVVSYSFQLLEGNRKNSITVNTEVVEDKVYFTWKSFFYEAEEVQLLVELSDGDLQTDSYSQVFSLVDYYTPSKIDIVTSNTKYDGDSTIEVSYTPINNVTMAKVYLIKDGIKVDITNAYNTTNDGSSFKLTLPDETIHECYIEFELTNENRTIYCQSETFEVRKVTPDEITITVTDTKYDGDSTIEVSYTPINNVTMAKVYLIKDGIKVDITNAYNTTNDGSSFKLTLPDETIHECYIEFELTNENQTIYCRSLPFAIIKCSTSKTCKKCNKNSVIVLISTIILLSSIIYTFRRKNR